MLRQLRLQNFRCYKDHTFLFEEHSVAVGRNNAGKSTLVDALLIVSAVLSKRGRTFKPVPAWLELPRFRRCVSPSVAALGLNLTTIFHRYSEPPAIVTATFSSGANVTIYIGKEENVYATVADGGGNWVSTPNQLQALGVPPVHVLAQLGPLRVEEPLLSPGYVNEWMYSRLSSLHFRNQLRVQSQHFAAFKELAEQTWPRLRIMPVTDGSGESGPTVSLMLRDGDFTAEVGWVGHGLQMWLQTMWFLARAEPDSTVILDEPDVYLHADLQRKLIRLLKRRFRQTIVTTHSVEIMAESEPSEVLVIDRSRKRSVYANSEPAVQHIVDHVGGIHNIHLARLWSTRRLILVEGKDVGFLRQFHALLFPDSEVSLDAIPNMPVGGWGGWNYAVGSSMAIHNAVGDPVVVYCLMDRDYHVDDEITTRVRDAESRGIQLHIWQKKEIENYLISAPAVRRVISRGIKGSTTGPGETGVVDQIDALAEKLKDTVIDGFAEQFIVADRARAGGAVKRARDWVNARWPDRGNRLAMVPGKELISRLSEWSKNNFGVSFGAVTILRAFKAQEIPHEVSAVIKAIETGGHLPETK